MKLYATKQFLVRSAAAFLAAAAVSCAGAADYFVSPGGSDQDPGTIGKPFATVRKAASLLKPGDICYLREGVYRETLRPVVSGLKGARSRFPAAKVRSLFLARCSHSFLEAVRTSLEPQVLMAQGFRLCGSARAETLSDLSVKIFSRRGFCLV